MVRVFSSTDPDADDRLGRLITPMIRYATSDGGGVHSSVLAFMACEVGFDHIPDCAVYAEAFWEPSSASFKLRRLGEQLRFPLHVVDNSVPRARRGGATCHATAHLSGQYGSVGIL